MAGYPVMEHPDITAAQRTGYPHYMCCENEDTPEARADYIEDHTTELVQWLMAGYPDILDEFIQFSGQACPISYYEWLN